jgi:hypothetical protein
VQVQSMLHAAGIDAEVKTYPANLLFATYGQGGVLSTGKFDLNISGWVAGQDPDDHSLFECRSNPAPRAPGRRRLLALLQQEMDASKRPKRSVVTTRPPASRPTEIQQLLARDLPRSTSGFRASSSRSSPTSRASTRTQSTSHGTPTSGRSETGFRQARGVERCSRSRRAPIARIPELRWLRNIIVERALTRGDYLLSGGARSDYYIDKFRLFSDPQVLRRIARLFAPVISEIAPDVIGGTELGGVIIATAVSSMTGFR